MQNVVWAYLGKRSRKGSAICRNGGVYDTALAAATISGCCASHVFSTE